MTAKLIFPFSPPIFRMAVASAVVRSAAIRAACLPV
ncbi:hypothetical protein J2T37_000147 [Neisseria perflava]|nr:hypothetical protein [Neisseria perflava]MCP1771726.1 hypothetical protein [Neisseria perflava]